jgi:hypothetical protein
MQYVVGFYSQNIPLNLVTLHFLVFDHIFLTNILNHICDKFDAINRHLQDQIKVDEDIASNIERVQELSHLHHNLVDLAA